MLYSNIQKRGVRTIKAVYYFGGSCPLSVWDTYSEAEVDSYLQRIRADGFNTVIAIVPVAVVPLKKNGSPYYDGFLRDLRSFIAKCRQYGLRYAFRLFYVWDSFPIKLNRLEQTSLVFSGEFPHYMAVAQDLNAMAADDDHFLFGFITWEDMIPQLIVTLPGQSPERRQAIGRLIGLSDRFADGAIPATNAPEYAAYLRYIDERFMDVLNSLRSAFPLLTAEVRVDYSPFPRAEGGHDMHVHEIMYRMPAEVDIVGTYYATYMGALNQHDEIDAKFAFAMFNASQRHVIAETPARIFVDQLLLYIGQEKYAHFSKLPAAEIEKFLFKHFLPWQRERGAGYANWSYQDYILAANSNATFHLGIDGWKIEGGERRTETGTLRLDAGGSVEQTSLTRVVRKSVVVLDIVHSRNAVITVDLGQGNSFKRELPDTDERHTVREYCGLPATKIAVRVESGSVAFSRIQLGWDQHSNGGYDLDFNPGVMSPILKKFNALE